MADENEFGCRPKLIAGLRPDATLDGCGGCEEEDGGSQSWTTRPPGGGSGAPGGMPGAPIGAIPAVPKLALKEGV